MVTSKGREDLVRTGLLFDHGSLFAVKKELEGLLGLSEDLLNERGLVVDEDNNMVVVGLAKEEIARLLYYSQSANRFLLVAAEGSYDDLSSFSNSQSLIDSFNQLGVDQLIGTEFSFKVSSIVSDDRFNSQELSAKVGGLLHEKMGWRVDLNNPDYLLLMVAANGSFIIGFDLSGFPLEKREYKIYHTRKSIRGTIAYSLVRFSGFTPGQTMLDPFCLDGTVAVEAAFFSLPFPVNNYRDSFSAKKMALFKDLDWDSVKNDHSFFESAFAGPDGSLPESKILAFAPQLKDVKNSRANAKIAGVDKSLKISKVDLPWLESKLDEGSVDHIVSVVPESGKSVSEKDARRLQEELFWQADYLLVKDEGADESKGRDGFLTGRVTLLVDKLDELLLSAREKGFVLEDRALVMMGKKDLWLARFKRGIKK